MTAKDAEEREELPEIKPPDWENPPCPACFAFDPVPPEAVPTTSAEHAGELRKIYASGLAAGFLMCRMRSTTWRHLCPEHLQCVQAVIDAVCADHGLPREKVYADFGIHMFGQEGEH